MQAKRFLKIVGCPVVVVTIVLLVIMMVAEPYRISGDCMEPAIKDGGLYFLNRIAAYVRRYQIDDIVVFDYEGRRWISRIVALENDTIELKDGMVWVNGSLLHEPRVVRRDWTDWKYGTYGINAPFYVPQGHVYVLSDNLAAHHDDSRVFGPVAHSSMVGVIW